MLSTGRLPAPYKWLFWGATNLIPLLGVSLLSSFR